ncbi:hypothetical protein N7526_008012 [Penicillium atrosanguineum]|nr:hypothetical protein N7526_008012 [Penicillium atrosanguineum]
MSWQPWLCRMALYPRMCRTRLANHRENGANVVTSRPKGALVSAAGVQNLSISGHAPSHGAQPQRPVSKIEQKDPREFQINQLRRRFRPEEKTDEKGVTLSFGMAPSDPDFPFELDKLQCVLHVPVSYPSAGRPTLSVTNPEMEAAYRVNVGRGFDDIVDYTLRSNGQGTLLSWMNSLDKQLERLLITLERGPKLTFVANVGQAPAPREQKPQLMPTSQHELPQSKGKAAVKVAPAPAPVSKAPIARKTHTATEKSQAEKRRSMEIKQLEARLGRLPMFQKRTDTSWIVPIQPNKVDRLPRSLQTIKTVKLLVPQLYPLELSSIEIQANDSPEARSVETGFTEWVEKNSQMNLVSQVNYLASNMHAFAKTPLPEVAEYSQHEHEHVQSDAESSAPEPSNGVLIEADGDRPHLHVIPRPPEWSVPDSNSDSEITDESSYDEEYSEEEEGEDTSEGGAPVPAAADDTPGRGVALSFPFMELYGIELLELVHLAITVKCFRRQMMHSHANRAGYLDLEGCIIVDLIPSNFLPTCSECSTVHPMPGVSAVRGESAMAICRHCHRKMVFKLPEVKFLVVGTAGITSRALPLKKKPREVLGIVAGQELPRRGRCQHYSKSHRWFRFSCCAKVFPCDKCHDADTDHPNEHANRMICGFCSREQIYRPENCGICKAVLVGKAGSGFWEGGKGTRNRALMSRKDPRKYKRRGGNPPGGSSSKKK